MSLVLNTNIDSMNAQNSLSTSGSELSTALEQLSSGLRINTAADDAAGYAIVQGMTSQINGLNQAAQNANDGVSLAQTGAGALQEVTNDLQTMRDLAVESLNATNSSADRADLNQQFQQLKADVDQVASTTAFNGVNLLDGSGRCQRRPDDHGVVGCQCQVCEPRRHLPARWYGRNSRRLRGDRR